MGDKAADAICATNNSNKKQKQLGPICRSNAVALKSKTCLGQQSVLDAAWSDNLGTLRLRPSQGICAFSHGGVFSELVPLLPPKSLALKHILHVITIESLCLKHLDIHGSIYSISLDVGTSQNRSRYIKVPFTLLLRMFIRLNWNSHVECRISARS